MTWALVAVFAAVIAVFAYEYRLRRPDCIVLCETRTGLGVRRGPFYPRHFSLPIRRTPHSLLLTVDATAAGNLGVRVKLAGSVALDPDHVQALIRVGGWNNEAVAHAARETNILLDSLVKECTEQRDIQTLSPTVILGYVNERASLTRERFGVELISLAVQSVEPTDQAVADALRQQEQARLLEQTERLSHHARVSAAKAKHEADQEITAMEHSLELQRAAMQKDVLEQEATLACQRLEHELARSRMRLQFEREELDLLKSSPELLMLTPQAARLAEASQSLKSARTIISLSPQELPHGTDVLGLFQELIQKAVDVKEEV